MEEKTPQTAEDLNLAAVEGLNRGNTGPLINLLESDAEPSRAVRDMIAGLLRPENEGRYKLSLQYRTRGNHSQDDDYTGAEPWTLGLAVLRLQARGVSYDAAIAAVAKDANVGERRVIDAASHAREVFVVSDNDGQTTIGLAPKSHSAEG